MENKLKQRRLELGLTLEQVGNLCGVGKSTVRKWEEGIINNMGRDKIVLLSKALRVSPLFILEDDEKVKTLTKYEETILQNCARLNKVGKKKALERIKELTYIPMYSEPDHLTVNAAHKRTDIELTPVGDAHDDAIMQDEDFWK